MAECVHDACGNEAGADGGACVAHGGLPDLLARHDWEDVDLVHFRGLDVIAADLNAVLAAIRESGGVLRSVDLSHVVVDGPVDLTKLQVTGQVRLTELRAASLRVSGMSMGSLEADQLRIDRGSAVIAHSRVVGAVKISAAEVRGTIRLLQVSADAVSLGHCRATGRFELQQVEACSMLRIHDVVCGEGATFGECSSEGPVEVHDVRSERADVAIVRVRGASGVIERLTAAQRIVVQDLGCGDTAMKRLRLADFKGRMAIIDEVSADEVTVRDIHAEIFELTAVRGTGTALLTDIDVTSGIGLKELAYDTMQVERVKAGGDMVLSQIRTVTSVLRTANVEGTLELSKSIADAMILSSVEADRYIHLREIQAQSLVADGIKCDGVIELAGLKANAMRGSFNCSVLAIRGSRLGSGRFAVASAEVECTDSGFEDGVRIGNLSSWRPGPAGDADGRSRGVRQDAPRLTSLERCDVSGLEVAGLDVTTCRYHGATGIAEMILTTECRWSRRTFRRRVPARLVLEEEAIGRGWVRSTGERVSDAELTDIYRCLRAAVESSRNENRASDLYFGEMEMRRRIATSWIERAALDLVWFTSGYGQRPLRPLVLLATIVTVTFLALTFFGLKPVARNPVTIDLVPSPAASATPGRSPTYSLQGVVVRPGHRAHFWELAAAEACAVVRVAPPAGITAAMTVEGELAVDALRVVGPILLLFSAVSFRNKTRR